VCCHNDGNPENNSAANLRWDTQRNNQIDRVAHGTTNRGEQHGAAKLTEAGVLAIRGDARLYREIAAEYGISVSTVSDLKHRRRWGHI